MELNFSGSIAIKNCPVLGGPPSSPAKEDAWVPKLPPAIQAVKISTSKPVPKPLYPPPVSYTHLTLPTKA